MKIVCFYKIYLYIAPIKETIMGLILTLNNSTMKQILTVLHAEDRLSPSALSIVKGGNGSLTTCRLNNCGVFSGSCTDNSCEINDVDCTGNKCTVNCKSHCGQNCQGNLISGENPGYTCTPAFKP